MNYTKEQIMSGIKHWQKMLKESNGFCTKLDKIVADENKEYEIFVDGEHYDSFSTLKDVSDCVNGPLTKYINDNITEIIEGDPEKYDITYNDDSDYDPEYGYGEYGEYDQKEIEKTAENITEDIIDKFNTSIDNIKDFDNFKSYDLADYAKLNNLEIGDDYICLASIEDEHFGIIEVVIFNK